MATSERPVGRPPRQKWLRTWVNPGTHERYDYGVRPDGRRELFYGPNTHDYWKKAKHCHNVLSGSGAPSYIREIGKRLIANDRL